MKRSKQLPIKKGDFLALELDKTFTKRLRSNKPEALTVI